MQYIADLLNLEVRVAAAREATAMGIANLAAHSALGISLEILLIAGNRKRSISRRSMRRKEAPPRKVEQGAGGSKVYHESLHHDNSR